MIVYVEYDDEVHDKAHTSFNTFCFNQLLRCLLLLPPPPPRADIHLFLVNTTFIAFALTTFPLPSSSSSFSIPSYSWSNLCKKFSLSPGRA